MRQDIREMTYIFSKEKQDKDFIYIIDLILYQFFEKRFGEELDLNFSPTYLDNIYLELLKDRDGIITTIIENEYDTETNYFGNIFINDTYKLYYLIDSEFLKQLDKCKKYYEKRLKTRNRVKDTELSKKIMSYFIYCFEKSSVNDTKGKLKLMSSSDFRKATIKDLDINIDNYVDFDKVYNKTLNEFKKIYKDDLDTNKNESNIGFGWKFYAIVKSVETLFKL